MKIHQPAKAISTSLSPNTQRDDILLALKLISEPHKWKAGKAIQRLEKEFKDYLGVKFAISFNSGRAALMAILEALGTRAGDEILLQAFTCNSAVIPILEKRALPVFVEVEETLNLDPEDLKRKITSHSRIVMVQHSFGWPAKIDKILKTAKKYNLFLIEDCAHSLGAKYKQRYCGTFGEAAFFSFGRDKIISSVFGGMALTNDEKLAKKIKEFQEKLSFPSNIWIFQQLLHPILTNYLVLPAYGKNKELGRIILGAFHKLAILSKAVSIQEKRGSPSHYFPKKLPNTLALLALNQLGKLEQFNNHRKEIASFYQKELKRSSFILPLTKKNKNIEPIFMRYPILTDLDTDKVLQKARKKKIYLNDGWRKSPIVPPDTDLEKMKYIMGSCPRAEKVAKSIINLPTHINISQADAQKITYFLLKRLKP